MVNTLLFLGIAVNLKMFCALLLSGFFMRRGWWVKALLMIYVLPWAVPALPTFISIHWMLNGQWGLVEQPVSALSGIDGPSGSMSAGWRSAQHLRPYLEMDAVLDGDPARRTYGDPAGPLRRGQSGRRHRLAAFVHINFPLLANLYLICTLLSTIFSLGDFNSVYFVTGGGPANSTHVLATLGIRDAFDWRQPASALRR